MVATVYSGYQRQLTRNEALDFDDLIMKTIQLFERIPDALEYYQNKFQYIHVDEYQDTNKAQYTLVKLLASKFKNLCVVGDSDQSIYGWRVQIFKISYLLKKITLMLKRYFRTKLSFYKDHPNSQMKSLNITQKESLKVCGLQILVAKN